MQGAGESKVAGFEFDLIFHDEFLNCGCCVYKVAIDGPQVKPAGEVDVFDCQGQNANDRKWGE